VVNLGRNVGAGLTDIAAAIEKDSTYGRLNMYLHGHKGGRVIENLNEEQGTMTINGVPVTFLRKARNPKDIDWQGNQVQLGDRQYRVCSRIRPPTRTKARGRSEAIFTPERKKYWCPRLSRFRPRGWTCPRMP
jgi:hypothetical protein